MSGYRVRPPLRCGASLNAFRLGPTSYFEDLSARNCWNSSSFQLGDQLLCLLVVQPVAWLMSVLSTGSSVQIIVLLRSRACRHGNRRATFDTPFRSIMYPQTSRPAASFIMVRWLGLHPINSASSCAVRYSLIDIVCRNSLCRMYRYAPYRYSPNGATWYNEVFSFSIRGCQILPIPLSSRV
jgi:hypothetical protein